MKYDLTYYEYGLALKMGYRPVPVDVPFEYAHAERAMIMKHRLMGVMGCGPVRAKPARAVQPKKYCLKDTAVITPGVAEAFIAAKCSYDQAVSVYTDAARETLALWKDWGKPGKGLQHISGEEFRWFRGNVFTMQAAFASATKYLAELNELLLAHVEQITPDGERSSFGVSAGTHPPGDVVIEWNSFCRAALTAAAKAAGDERGDTLSIRWEDVLLGMRFLPVSWAEYAQPEGGTGLAGISQYSDENVSDSEAVIRGLAEGLESWLFKPTAGLSRAPDFMFSAVRPLVTN